jgi:hypothetical protein
VQLRVGYLFGGNRDLSYALNPGEPKDDEFSGKYDYSILEVNILGKYPFRIGPITLSPVVGVGYTLFTRLIFPDNIDDFGGEPVQDAIDFIRNDQSDEFADFATVWFQSSNRWWISAGLDAEIPLVGSIFLQPSVLAQFGLASSTERNVKELYNNQGADSYSQSNFRLQTSLSVGYRF